MISSSLSDLLTTYISLVCSFWFLDFLISEWIPIHIYTVQFRSLYLSSFLYHGDLESLSATQTAGLCSIGSMSFMYFILPSLRCLPGTNGLWVLLTQASCSVSPSSNWSVALFQSVIYILVALSLSFLDSNPLLSIFDLFLVEGLVEEVVLSLF